MCRQTTFGTEPFIVHSILDFAYAVRVDVWGPGAGFALPLRGCGPDLLPADLCFESENDSPDYYADSPDTDVPLKVDSPDYYADGRWLVTRKKHFVIVQNCSGVGMIGQSTTVFGRLEFWCVAEPKLTTVDTIRFRARPFLSMWYELVKYEGQRRFELKRKATYIEPDGDDYTEEDIVFELVLTPGRSIVVKKLRTGLLTHASDLTTWIRGHCWRLCPLMQDVFMMAAEQRLMDYIVVSDRHR